MALENVWLLPMVEKFLREEEQKEEKNYLYPPRPDTKNNDDIFRKYEGVTFSEVAPFFLFN